MSTPGKRGLIRTAALAAAAAAIAVAAGTAATHSTPAAHHALADGGVVNSRN